MRNNQLEPLENVGIDALKRCIAHCRKKCTSFTDKYGQFLAIASRYVAMRDQLHKHKNDKVFKTAFRKVRRRYIDLREEINKEASYYDVLKR
jgi:hypothetical protein